MHDDFEKIFWREEVQIKSGGVGKWRPVGWEKSWIGTAGGRKEGRLRERKGKRDQWTIS